MVELRADFPLQGYSRKFDGVSIKVVPGYSIFSVGIPTGSEIAVQKTIASDLQIKMPKAGQFSRASTGTGLIIAMQQSQLFHVWEYRGDNALEMVPDKLKEKAYIADQSDSWVIFEVSGAQARKVLERVCLIDLYPDIFPPGSMARTKMEHLGVVLMCMQDDGYWLMTARSSADSFLHMIETSAMNVA